MSSFGMTQFSTFGTAKSGDVLTVTLNRPESRNSVTVAMLEELIELAARLRSADDIRFVVFRSDGPAFSSGADLKQSIAMLQLPAEEREAEVFRHQRLGLEMMTALEGVDQITVAEVGGAAYGAGMTIVMTTDFRVMSEDAILNVPETRAGIFLTWGCTARLTNSVGALRAKEIIMLAEDIPADRCVDLGLANAVAPRAELSRWTDDLLAKLRARGAHAISITKKLVAAASPHNTPGAQLLEPHLAVGISYSDEMLDGFTSILP